ncbi:hypothetical protein ACLOJK_023781 [Asimina triloba]
MALHADWVSFRPPQKASMLCSALLPELRSLSREVDSLTHHLIDVSLPIHAAVPVSLSLSLSLP